LEVVNTYKQGVTKWLHWSGPLEIKFAWSGPWTETSLTPLGLGQCFSTPGPRTHSSPRKALAESANTRAKQGCCNALRQ